MEQTRLNRYKGLSVEVYYTGTLVSGGLAGSVIFVPFVVLVPLCAEIRDHIQWRFYINFSQHTALKVRPCLLVINRIILSAVGDTSSYQIADC